MKKFTAILLVLTMFFSMGTMAFAAVPGGEATDEGGFTDATNTAITTVKIQADTQLSATVPLNVTLGVDKDGAIQAPTNYAIKTDSVIPIKVSKVVVTPATGVDLKGITIAAGAEAVGILGTAEVTLSPTTTDWNVATTPGTTITFGGTMEKVPAEAAGTTGMAAAFTVTYTIAAGTHTAP